MVEAGVWGAEVVFLLYMILQILTNAYSVFHILSTYPSLYYLPYQVEGQLTGSVIGLFVWGIILALLIIFKIIYIAIPLGEDVDYYVGYPVILREPVPRIIRGRLALQFRPFYQVNLYNAERRQDEVKILQATTSDNSNIFGIVYYSWAPLLAYPQLIIKLGIGELNHEEINNGIKGLISQHTPTVIRGQTSEFWLANFDKITLGIVKKIARRASDEQVEIENEKLNSGGGCLVNKFIAARITRMTCVFTRSEQELEAARLQFLRKQQNLMRDVNTENLIANAQKLAPLTGGDPEKAVRYILADEGKATIIDTGNNPLGAAFGTYLNKGQQDNTKGSSDNK